MWRCCPDSSTLIGLTDPGDDPARRDIDDWFLCGPQVLTDIVHDTPVARGHKAGNVHREHAATPRNEPRGLR